MFEGKLGFLPSTPLSSPSGSFLPRLELLALRSPVSSGACRCTEASPGCQALAGASVLSSLCWHCGESRCWIRPLKLCFSLSALQADIPCPPLLCLFVCLGAAPGGSRVVPLQSRSGEQTQVGGVHGKDPPNALEPPFLAEPRLPERRSRSGRSRL